MHPGHGPAKPVTRAEVRRRRLARAPHEAVAVADGLADQVEHVLPDGTDGTDGVRPERAAGPAPTVVAAYLSLPGEPGTAALRARLRASGVTVLLPWLQDDRDLDWVVDTGQDTGQETGQETGHEGTGQATAGTAGTATGFGAVTRPSGRRLGPDAVTVADVVLVPALAVDGAGTRLGQGGGSYDRSLARLPATERSLVLAVVHTDEVLPAGALPVEEHDVAVDGALTPAGLTLFRDAGRGARARPPRPPRA